MGCTDRGMPEPSAGMSVIDWCAGHGITKANYYYRLRRVREACLESHASRGSGAADCPGKPRLSAAGNTKRQRYTAGAFRFCKWFSIHVTESPPIPLLAGSPGGGAGCSMSATCFKTVYIVCGYTDLRAGMDRLAALVEAQTGNRPYIKDTLYLFCGRLAQTASRGLYGKGTDGSCYTNAALRKPVPVAAYPGGCA